MSYSVVFTTGAKKKLKKLDKTHSFSYYWLDRKNLQGCNNPRVKGKGLTGNHSGQWRYRIGDYRLTTECSNCR